jgi:hypothetical protein
MSNLWVKVAVADHCLKNYPGDCRDEVLPVAALVKHLRPFATYPEKVPRYADEMRQGEWDHEDSPIHMAHAPEGPVLIDGNHRLLAAEEAGVTHVPVHVKTLHGAENAIHPDLQRRKP